MAFSRLQGVSVVIHQLNEALWRVDPAENTPAETEIHISYHNGDHYNSVRHLDEKRGLKIPAGIRIQTTPKSKHKDYNKKQVRIRITVRGKNIMSIVLPHSVHNVLQWTPLNKPPDNKSSRLISPIFSWTFY